jgi:glycosyltransferase involved in cell wall biosynthesis
LRENVKISVVVPVLNEQETIALFVRTCAPMLESVCRDQLKSGTYEIIFIDDGSTDATRLAVLDEAKANTNIKLVRFSRNFGKEAALAAGFRHATGDAVIPMDVDLQDPPEVVPRMVEKWLEGAEIVNAIRRRRDTDTAVKRFTAKLFYKLYNKIADIPIKADVGDFRLLDRAVVETLNELSEGSRFTKALYSWVGYRNVDIEYDRAGRSSGDTKWPYRRLIRFALDGLIGSTTAPLRVWSYIGLLIGFLAFVYAAWVIVKTAVLGVDVPGYASTLVTVLLLGGLNLLSLGIMGEYIGRMSQEVRNRPLYVVRETYGWSNENGKSATRPAKPAPEAKSGAPAAAKRK